MQRFFIQEKLGVSDNLALSPSRIKKLKKDASKNMGNTALEVIGSHSQSYVLTKNQKYANKAIEWTIQLTSWDPEGVSSMNDFSDSRCMLATALAFVTIYDQVFIREIRAMIRAIASPETRTET